jgi:D-aminoacyl-tRNA deacylase
MRVVIQRVNNASVTIDGSVHGKIGTGMVVLLGIEHDDNTDDVSWLTNKISRLRIFDDADGVMNLSLKEAGGEVMVISQFTLHAKTKKGNRPSYIRAAAPEKAIPLYEAFIASMETELSDNIVTGIFGAEMKIALINDGPVTIIIDTKNKE